MQPRTRISSPHLSRSRYTTQHFLCWSRKDIFSLAFIMMTHLPYFASGKVNIKFGVRSKSPSLLYSVSNIEIWPFFSTKSSELFMFTQSSPVHISMFNHGPGPGAWCPHLTEADDMAGAHIRHCSWLRFGDNARDITQSCQASSALCSPATSLVCTLGLCLEIWYNHKYYLE